MSLDFQIERLAPHHNRVGFSCGSPILDRYFREQAGQDERRHVAHCFVARDPVAGDVAGFYTLAAASIPIGAIEEALKRKLPPYPQLPAALVGRLAVDLRFQGRSVGAGLIIDAAIRAMKSEPAVYALVVDAKDDAAAAFYRHNEFVPFVGEPRKLFLPLATFRKVTHP